MKYIKTKDGKIHEVVLILKQSNVYLVNANLSDGSDIYGDLGYSREDILKEADSIEEMCDYFTLEGAFEYANPRIYWSCGAAKNYAKKTGQRIIGYIVIEKKGVKAIEPVAKTNDEGEFELL